MKQIKSILSIAIVMLVAFSCQKTAVNEEIQQGKASLKVDGLLSTAPEWDGQCDAPYDVKLLYRKDLGDGTFEWVWAIRNESQAPNLTSFSIKIPECVPVVRAQWARNDYKDGLLQTFTPTIGALRCTPDISNGHPVLTYPVVTSGTNITHLVLVVRGNYAIDLNSVAYYTNANGCGSTCFPGIGAVCTSCSFSQGRYFASPHAWPTATVTVGGYTYTETEGRAIFRSSNQGGISGAKLGFTQVAAIKLSAGTISLTASVWADVKIVEDFLKTLPKLTPTNANTFDNKAVAQAAGRIGDWIDANHCKE